MEVRKVKKGFILPTAVVIKIKTIDFVVNKEGKASLVKIITLYTKAKVDCHASSPREQSVANILIIFIFHAP